MYIQSECTVQMYTDYAFCPNIMANKSIPAVSHVHKNKLLKKLCKKKNNNNNFLPKFHNSVLQLLPTLLEIFGIHIFPYMAQK